MLRSVRKLQSNPTPELTELPTYLNAVNESAGRTRGLWLGYIALLAYLIITVGAVTHRDLLLETPVQLPALNIKLPLIGFFAVAPVLFLINHFYLMLQLLTVGRRIFWFNEQLEKADLKETEKNANRIKLDTFAVVLMLGGRKEERSGLTGFLFRAIAFITVVLAPLTLLLFMQVVFLPYHLEWLTWLHRLAIFIDLIVILAFWPAIREGGWKRPNLLRLLGAFSIIGLVELGSIGLATFPGEVVHRKDISNPIDCLISWKFESNDFEPRKEPYYWYGQGQFGEREVLAQYMANKKNKIKKAVCPNGKFPLRDLLFAGPVDDIAGSRLSLFSNSLVLPDAVLINLEELEKTKKRHEESNAGTKLWETKRTLSLRGRNLREAVFVRTDLRNADLYGTELQEASLDSARLEGALLEFANLQSTSLKHANFQGATLDATNIQGAILDGAQMQGVSLRVARLQGASLRGAKMQGASLHHAKLQGSSLFETQLQGSLLTGANFQGASFISAQLQGAIIDDVDFRGALLDRTELQGAQLNGVKFRGADFSSTSLWRASKDIPAQTDIAEARFRNLNFEAMTSEELVILELSALDGITSEEVQLKIKERLAPLKVNTDDQSNKEILKSWHTLGGINSDEIYQEILASVLRELACNGGYRDKGNEAAISSCNLSIGCSFDFDYGDWSHHTSISKGETE